MLISRCLVQVSIVQEDYTYMDQRNDPMTEHEPCVVEVCILSMHDQLRDLAYSIVRKEASSVARRTRLLGMDAVNAHGNMVCSA